MLTLHSLLSDHAVLQRDEPISICGSAAPGATVEVLFDDETVLTTADPSGKWRLLLEPRPAGGPYRLKVSSGGEELLREDLHIGEVWFCSGQSNMEWQLEQSDAGETEIHGARFPELRFFHVPNLVSLTPEEDFDPSLGILWKPCTPDSARRFSAVAYHFGRRLLPEIECAVGLISSAWGGTMALPWTPRESIAADPVLCGRLDDLDLVHEITSPAPQTLHEDTGNEGAIFGWAQPDCDLHDWLPMTLPCYWQHVGLAINGAVWFRRVVEIPSHWIGQSLALHLGVVDDFDVTYFNGAKVGSTGTEHPSAWRAHRQYTVPGTLVEAGRAVIAVRVFDWCGEGGMIGPAFQMSLSLARDPGDRLLLAGEWLHKVERGIPLPLENGRSNTLPTVLFNAMVSPCTGFPVRGFIWYQGESDTSSAELYAPTLTALINGWRTAWGGGERPFYIVQLANYHPVDDPQGDEKWPALREAQAEVAAAVLACDYCVTLDCGEAHDIHPLDKRSVGHRLAALALAGAYGKCTVTASGPRYLRHMLQDGRIHLSVSHHDSCLRSKNGGPVTGFEIAGRDRILHPAAVDFYAASLALHSPAVSNPVELRYAWAAAPVANLVNGDGWPASPFRVSL